LSIKLFKNGAQNRQKITFGCQLIEVSNTAINMQLTSCPFQCGIT